MGWIEASGAAPGQDDLRQWLRAQVPEYTPRGVVPTSAV